MANLPDPSTLTDEELDKILAGEEPDEDSQDENLDDDSQDDANTDVDNQDEEDEDEQDDDSEEEDKDKPDKKDKSEPKTPPEKKDDEDKSKPPSRREQMRIRQLLEKYGPPAPSGKPEVKDALDYDEALNADEATKEKLRKDRDKVASESFSQGLEQAKTIEFKTLLEIDAPRVEAKYPQLDKNSDEFKEDAATDVNLLYLQLAGWDPQTQRVQNPGIRYGNFVDTIFTLVKDLASQEAQTITKNVKKQASKTGLRPDGSRTKKLNLNKAPEDMTDEELDAYLAQAIPN